MLLLQAVVHFLIRTRQDDDEDDDVVFVVVAVVAVAFVDSTSKGAGARLVVALLALPEVTATIVLAGPLVLLPMRMRPVVVVPSAPQLLPPVLPLPISPRPTARRYRSRAAKASEGEDEADAALAVADACATAGAAVPPEALLVVVAATPAMLDFAPLLDSFFSQRKRRERYKGWGGHDNDAAVVNAAPSSRPRWLCDGAEVREFRTCTCPRASPLFHSSVLKVLTVRKRMLWKTRRGFFSRCWLRIMHAVEVHPRDERRLRRRRQPSTTATTARRAVHSRAWRVPS